MELPDRDVVLYAQRISPPEETTVLVIWRGLGFLALLPILVVVASCAGLFSLESMSLFMLVGGSGLFLGGVGCVYFGTRWNRPVVEHSLYGVPLQLWGWGYMGLVAICALGAVVGGVKQGLDKPQWLYQTIAGGVCLLMIAAASFFLIRSEWFLPPVRTLDREDDDSDDRAPWD